VAVWIAGNKGSAEYRLRGRLLHLNAQPKPLLVERVNCRTILHHETHFHAVTFAAGEKIGSAGRPQSEVKPIGEGERRLGGQHHIGRLLKQRLVKIAAALWVGNIQDE